MGVILSNASTPTSMQAFRPGVTVGVAPSFRVTERAQKRKEFNTMLKKKQRVLEAEKREYEARLKEEEEEAIKQLRKGLVVRAHSVPSFYYDEPPPKVELKKPPLTRPKSPNLVSHRRTCSDTTNSVSDENGVCNRLLRNSTDTCKRGSAASTPTKHKDQWSRH